MKNRVWIGLAALVSGGLTALGPQYIFKICDQTHHEVTKCFWTARAEIGIGGTLAALGIAYMLFGNPRVRLGLTVALLLQSLQVFLVPNLLIGVCEHPHMACRLATLPALNSLSIATALLAAANIIYLLKTSGSSSDA